MKIVFVYILVSYKNPGKLEIHCLNSNKHDTNKNNTIFKDYWCTKSVAFKL